MGMSEVALFQYTVLNAAGALLWAVVIGILGYWCGHVLELMLGELKHLEMPILIAIAALGGLWFFYRKSRHRESLRS